MPKKVAKDVTMIPAKGVKLEVTEGTLVGETADQYILEAITKSGRGRGMKYQKVTYYLPKHLILYYKSAADLDPEDVSDDVKQAAAPAAAPKLRGRPKKAASVDAPAAAPKKKRGRPKKADAADAPPKKKRGPKKAAAADAPPKKKRGRPKKADAADAPPKKKRGRPKKAAAPAPKKRKPPVVNNRAGALFDEDF